MVHKKYTGIWGQGRERLSVPAARPRKRGIRQRLLRRILAELSRAVRYICTICGPIWDQSKRAAWALPRSRRRSRGSDRLRTIAREALAELPLRKTAVVLLAFHADAAPIVVAFRFVPVEALGVRVFGAVCLDEDDGHIGVLDHAALVADQAVLVGVYPLVILAAVKFPDKLDK